MLPLRQYVALEGLEERQKCWEAHIRCTCKIHCLVDHQLTTIKDEIYSADGHQLFKRISLLIREIQH